MNKRVVGSFAFFSVLIVILSLVSASPMSSPRIHVRDGLSTNWAGYAALTNLNFPQNGAVSDVKGSWIVPSVNCSNPSTAYSAFWVGIDGYSSSTVEQIGTDSDCSSGNARYYAWYEMYPKFPVNLNMQIYPGDVINAEVKYLGNGNFKLIINDSTIGRVFSTTQKSSRARRSSAEWIAEAPSSSGGVLPLANFGNFGFSNSETTINGINGAINDSHWQNDKIDMVTSDGTILKAQTSTLSNNGKSFSIQWLHQ